MSDTTAPKSLFARTILKAPDVEYVRVEVRNGQVTPASTVKPKSGVVIKGNYVPDSGGGKVHVWVNPTAVNQQTLVRAMNARLGGIFLDDADTTGG
jgi:hypothetical protein